jgi:hypothetical protein
MNATSQDKTEFIHFCESMTNAELAAMLKRWQYSLGTLVEKEREELVKIVAERLHNSVDNSKRDRYDDLVASGWSLRLAHHYRKSGRINIFFSFVRDGLEVNGEGPNETRALDAIRAEIARQDAPSNENIHNNLRCKHACKLRDRLRARLRRAGRR